MFREMRRLVSCNDMDGIFDMLENGYDPMDYLNRITYLYYIKIDVFELLVSFLSYEFLCTILDEIFLDFKDGDDMRYLESVLYHMGELDADYFKNSTLSFSKKKYMLSLCRMYGADMTHMLKLCKDVDDFKVLVDLGADIDTEFSAEVLGMSGKMEESSYTVLTVHASDMGWWNSWAVCGVYYISKFAPEIFEMVRQRTRDDLIECTSRYQCFPDKLLLRGNLKPVVERIASLPPGMMNDIYSFI